MKNGLHTKVGGAVVALSALFFFARSAQAACMPKIEGPIPVTADSKIFEPPTTPYAGPTPPTGEMEEEFFISCNVKAGSYKTLLHVTLPADPSRQSGIVIAEPWLGNFWTIYDKARRYITRTGDVSVVIVSNASVLEGNVKKGDPARYASLNLPGEDPTKLFPDDVTTENEVDGQVGALIKSGGIPGVKARKVIFGGMSGSGHMVRSYIEFEHAEPGAKSVFDGYFPAQAARPTGTIADIDVPVLEVQGERELVSEMRNPRPVIFRRADGPLYRLVEVAGAPHIATRDKIEPGVPDCIGHPWTDFPTDMVFAATLDNLVRWVDRGVPAPHVARIAMVPKANEVRRDKYGNAVGGLRTSYLEVPIATYHSNWGDFVRLPDGSASDPLAAKCDQIGWTAPLAPATLKKLYPTHADYVAKVNKATASLVKEHMLLPEDAAILRDEAVKASIP